MRIFNKKRLFIFETKKNRLVNKIAFCCLLSCFVFASVAFAQNNVNAWYDNCTQEITEYQEIYNDGTLQVTAKVDGKVSPVTGDVTCENNIVLKNLSSTGYIKLNNVKAIKKQGFEEADIDNWTVKNASNTLFEGDTTTDFIPDFKIAKDGSNSFNVATSLTGKAAIDLANTTPFSFVYNYDLIEPSVNYQVCIWGIEEDKVIDPTHVAGISFGPACGEHRTCLEVDCHEQHGSGKHCIHEDSWEEIIQNCNEGNWNIYSDCIKTGCTKSIPLKINPDLCYTERLRENYVCSSINWLTRTDKYDLNAWHDDSSCACSCWATSRARATYNGYDEAGSNFTPSKYAYESKNDCLTSENCFLSCFPDYLASEIKPKYYRVPATWNFKGSTGDIYTCVDVVDKLWGPSIEEVWGPSDNNVRIEFYEKQYSKMAMNDINWSNYKYLVCWGELGSPADAWTCSPSRRYNYYGWAIQASGVSVSTSCCSMAPFFCLGEKEIHLDNYSLEELCDASSKIQKIGNKSPVYTEFETYMIKDEIWWSNSDGYFNENGYDYSSVITNDDVLHCNQVYKNKFTNLDGSSVEDCNNFIFLRPIGIYDDYIAGSKSGTFDRQGITFQVIHALPQARQMGGSKGGNWSGAGLRSWLNSSVVNMLCDEFKNSLKNTSVFYNSTRSTINNIKYENNKLFVPSYSQAWSINKDSSLDECAWYSNGYSTAGKLTFDPTKESGLISEAAMYRWAFKNSIDGTSGNEKLKYLALCNDGTNPEGYEEVGTWLRSVDYDNQNNYFCINSEGCINSKIEYGTKMSVAPCFCI